jgi:hypothetical protein
VLLPVRSSEEPNPVHRVQLEGPKYTIEQIGAKVGKAPAYVASRARLTELIPAVVEAFYAEEIGVGIFRGETPHIEVKELKASKVLKLWRDVVLWLCARGCRKRAKMTHGPVCQDCSPVN